MQRPDPISSNEYVNQKLLGLGPLFKLLPTRAGHESLKKFPPSERNTFCKNDISTKVRFVLLISSASNFLFQGPQFRNPFLFSQQTNLSCSYYSCTHSSCPIWPRSTLERRCCCSRPGRSKWNGGHLFWGLWGWAHSRFWRRLDCYRSSREGHGLATMSPWAKDGLRGLHIAASQCLRCKTGPTSVEFRSGRPPCKFWVFRAALQHDNSHFKLNKERKFRETLKIRKASQHLAEKITKQDLFTFQTVLFTKAFLLSAWKWHFSPIFPQKLQYLPICSKICAETRKIANKSLRKALRNDLFVILWRTSYQWRWDWHSWFWWELSWNPPGICRRPGPWLTRCPK